MQNKTLMNPLKILAKLQFSGKSDEEKRKMTEIAEYNKVIIYKYQYKRLKVSEDHFAQLHIKDMNILITSIDQYLKHFQEYGL